MHRSASLRLVLLLVPLAPFAACNNAPIDPGVLADRAALSAREVVHQTGGGVAFTQSSDSGLHKLGSGFGDAMNNLQGMAAVVPPGMMNAMMGSPMAQAAAGMPTLSTTEEQFDDTADDLKVWLRERVLADVNLESKTTDEAVYLLKGDPTCRALPHAEDPPGTVLALNSKCVDELTKLQVRVVLREDGDGVRLDIDVGPDRLELSSFIIQSNLLAIEVDFAKTYAASQYVDQALGNDSPMNGTTFDALEGSARMSLRKDGEKRATFALSVLTPIHVAEKGAGGTLGPDVRFAASDPTWSLAVDGVAQTATASVNYGAMDVLTNWDPKGTGAAPNRDLHVTMGAITASTTFTEGKTELDSKGVGIGATSIQVRGMTVFDLGLNPQDMHRFDMKITLAANGQPHVELTPRFDLSIGTHFNLIAADYDSPPASYVLDETYGVRLDNGGAASTVESVPASGAFTGGIKVGPGTLTISSNKVAQPLTVTAGKCLTSVSNPPADAHPILGAFAVVDCP